QAMIPARLFIQAVDRFDVIEKGGPELLGARIEAVQVGLLVLAALCAAQDDIPLIGGEEDQLLLPVETAENRVVLPLAVTHFDRHANAAVRPEIEDQNRVAHPRRAPVEEDDVQSSKIGEVDCAGFVARSEIVQRTILEVADVLDRDGIPLTHAAGQDRHAGLPVALVARLLPEPPDEEKRHDAEQNDERLPKRLPEREHGDDADGPGRREQRGPFAVPANIVVNRTGHPERYDGGA